MSTSTGRPPAGREPPHAAGWHDRQRRTAELVAELATAPGPFRAEGVRRQLVLVNLPLATGVARRYAGRGEPLEDLVQTARLGLVKAAHGFDQHVGEDFASYAVPTITGEVKRHFRDHGWHIRPPRRMQELRAEIARARQALEQELGGSPTAAQVARHLGVGEEAVLECLATADLYHVGSLQVPDRAATGQVAMDVPVVEERFELVDEAISVRPLIEALPARDRWIIHRRFALEWTQARIAAELGVSQVQVSRLLGRIVARLRTGLGDGYV